MDRLLKWLGIAEGAYFLWFTVSGGVLVIGVGSLLLALLTHAPWWSVLLILAGLLGLTIGFLNWLARTVASRLTPRSEAYYALTRVIEAGRDLRQRLSELDGEPVEDERERWEVRLKDWQNDADRTVERVAPFRLLAFQVDEIITYYPGVTKGRPETLAKWEYDLEKTLDRLLYIRVTL